MKEIGSESVYFVCYKIVSVSMDPSPKKVIALFDVDGTLSESRKVWSSHLALKD